jgi:hypothetical protein
VSVGRALRRDPRDDARPARSRAAQTWPRRVPDAHAALARRRAATAAARRVRTAAPRRSARPALARHASRPRAEGHGEPGATRAARARTPAAADRPAPTARRRHAAWAPGRALHRLHHGTDVRPREPRHAARAARERLRSDRARGATLLRRVAGARRPARARAHARTRQRRRLRRRRRRAQQLRRLRGGDEGIWPPSPQSAATSASSSPRKA